MSRQPDSATAPRRTRSVRSRVQSAALAAALVATPTLLSPAPALGQSSLTPTRPALLKQVYAARDHDYSYLRDSQEVLEFARKGYLVELRGNRDYVVKYDVDLPYARPEIKIFLERLSAQYREACGEKLVVTSLVRPKNRQPRNSSPLSVHPTGIAMDFRIPANGKCRSWLENAFLNLEATGVVEAARERRPPHYHVVLVPNRYTSYLAKVHGVEVDREVTRVATLTPDATLAAQARPARTGEARTATAPPTATSATAAQPTAARSTAAQSTVAAKPTVAKPTAAQSTVAAKPTAAPKPAAQPAAVRHEVSSGENLWVIARKYKTSVNSIRAANDLTSNSLRPGQVLTIERDSGSGSAAAPRALRHEVRSGENLWIIARKYDTSVNAVRSANNLRSSSLRPGQVLTIPAD